MVQNKKEKKINNKHNKKLIASGEKLFWTIFGFVRIIWIMDCQLAQTVVDYSVETFREA